MTSSPHILHIDHAPPAPGLLRVHYHGGAIVDVPAGDVIESDEVMQYRRERAIRESAYMAPERALSLAPGVSMEVSRCGCWHRPDGTHAPDCPATDAGDFLPPWRETQVEVSGYLGTDENGRKRFSKTMERALVPPVVREPVIVGAPAYTAPEQSEHPAQPELVAVLDTETTGLRPDGRVCEIAVAIVDLASGKILARASQLIDPGPVLMPAAALRVHGITDAMLCGMPKLSEVWPKITAFVEKHCPSMEIIAHNAPFDRGILSDDLARHGLLPCDWPRWHWRDSITLCKRIIPGLPTYSLHDNEKGMGLASRLKLPQGGHRAMGDVLTTCAILQELRKRTAKPFLEWAGEAHVWGVGVQKELKAPAVKVASAPAPARITVEAASAPTAPTPAPPATSTKRPRTARALPAPVVVRDLFAAGGSR